MHLLKASSTVADVNSVSNNISINRVAGYYYLASIKYLKKTKIMSQDLTIQQRWLRIIDQIAIAQKMTQNSASTLSKHSDPFKNSDQNLDNSATPSERIVSTIAVSKRQAIDSIEQAYAAGAINFAESFVQEAIPKITALSHLDKIIWHFIGPIQSNKSKQIAEHFDWVHSVEREKIARRLSQQRPQQKPPLNLLIQVNISSEQSKSGIRAEELLPLAKQIIELPNLKLRGLMCIAQNSDHTGEVADSFHRMEKLYQTLSYYCKEFNHTKIDTLSMGMSNDFQQAILAGSTMVRIGSALFGSR